MLGLAASWLLGGMLLAQLPATGDIRLDRIRVVMGENLMHLPNYTCLMTIDRSSRQTPRTPIQHEDTMHLEVAEVAGKEIVGWPGTKLGDKEMAELIGQGLIATGDFAIIANVIFRSRAPKFKLRGEKKLNGRLAVEYAFEVEQPVSQYLVSSGGKKAIVGYRGRLWADAESLELMRLEYEMDDIPREIGIHDTQTEIDYQKAHIGAGDFLLPAKVDRRLSEANGLFLQNITKFTECKQYGTESSIRFDEIDSTAATAAPPKPAIDVTLPEGVRIPMKIETVFHEAKTATGDPILARTTAEIRSRDTVIPIGSQVIGRVRDLHRNRSGILALQMEFTEIHAPELNVHIACFLEEAGKQKGVTRPGSMTIPGILLVEPRRLNLAGMDIVYRTLDPNGK